MKCAYFITSHGYGHGVRACALANAFPEDISLAIRSDLPETFFREELKRDFTLSPARFDCGCLQVDSVTVDIEATVTEYSRIAERNKKLLEQELAWCIGEEIDCIITDITSFACEIAKNAGIPCVAVGNFSWVDVYQPYVHRFPWFQPWLDEMSRQYALADILFRLYPANVMSQFTHIRDVGLIGRKGQRRRDALCAHFGINPCQSVALVYTGTFGMEKASWHRLEEFTDWSFISLQEIPVNLPNCYEAQKSDFPFQDLTASVDCVVSKIGYGIMSECMLSGVPLLYLPRENFCEYPVLENAVHEWGGGIKISAQDFFNLSWHDGLSRAQAIRSSVTQCLDCTAQTAGDIISLLKKA